MRVGNSKIKRKCVFVLKKLLREIKEVSDEEEREIKRERVR